ncbi:MAG: hypothetical protein LUH45_02900, partial [Clostridiales bacterium]|nr:hypothetical protein [Clostridiales bacterium]
GFEGVALRIVTYSPPLSGEARGVVGCGMALLLEKVIQYGTNIPIQTAKKRKKSCLATIF